MKTLLALLLTITAAYSQCSCVLHANKTVIRTSPDCASWRFTKDDAIIVEDPIVVESVMCDCAKPKPKNPHTDPWYHVVPAPKSHYGAVSITTTTVTNWTSIGEFTWVKDNSHFDVQEGTISTNTVATIDYDGGHYETVLKSVAGPSVGERRILKRGANQWWQTTPGIYLTNGLVQETWAVPCTSTNFYFGNCITNIGSSLIVTNSGW